MNAAVLTGYQQPLSIRKIPIPELKADEVRLQVLAVGICSTDLHIRAGRMPFIQPPHVQGHEIIGIADACGVSVVDMPTDTRYVVGIDVVCGTCAYCRSGRPNLCIRRERLGFERQGGFAEFINVPARNLVAFPDTLPVAQGAIIPDALACMFHALVGQGKTSRGQRIVLIGLGGLGFQGIQIARHFGATVIATSRDVKKVEPGLRLGALAVCRPSLDEISRCMQEQWGQAEADVVVDNIGTSETLALALALCGRGGKVLVVGYEDTQAPINVYDLMLNEKEVIGVRGSTIEDLRESVELVKKGAVIPYVTNEYAFENINQALDDLQNGLVIGRAVVHVCEPGRTR